MNRRRAERLLRDIDTPRAPRHEFDAQLRAELFGTSEAGDDSTVRHERDDDDDDDLIVESVVPDATTPIRGHSARTRWLAAAAVVVISVGVVTAVALRSRNDRVDVAGQPPASVVNEIKWACVRFNSAAFSEVDRIALVGDDNKTLFADPEKARRAMTRFRSALSTFGAELEAAGVHSSAVFNRLDVARGDAASALAALDRGSAAQAAEDARLIENELIAIERALGDAGVAGCL